MKKGCLYSIGGLAVFVLAIIIAWHIYCYYHFPPKGKKYQPVVNPHPKYFLTVSGFIDPTLKDKLQVSFRANYYTTNKACMASFSVGDALDGVEFGREKSLIYTVDSSIKGFYKLNIPLDKYKTGFCQWKLSGINYSYTYNHKIQKAYSDTALPFAKIGQSNQKIKQSWLCDNSFCMLQKKYLMPLISLSKHHNQTLHLNFIKDKNNAKN